MYTRSIVFSKIGTFLSGSNYVCIPSESPVIELPNAHFSFEIGHSWFKLGLDLIADSR